MKILAVDNDEMVLDVVRLLLGKSGENEVHTALGATAALEMLSRDEVPFDCLMLDIRMPGMNGIELCESVRRIPHYLECPIIMLTTVSEMSEVEKAFRAGATDYVTKPFEVNDLTTRVRLAAQSHQRLETLRKNELIRPLKIQGMDSAVSFTAMQNYIEKLDKERRKSSWVFAVKIDRVVDLHARTSPEDFLRAVNLVAEAVADNLEGFGFVLSYSGEGRFVCISHDMATLDRDRFQRELQYRMDDKGFRASGGEALTLDLIVGAPMRPRISGPNGASVLLDKVLNRAETESLTKGQDPVPPAPVASTRRR